MFIILYSHGTYNLPSSDCSCLCLKPEYLKSSVTSATISINLSPHFFPNVIQCLPTLSVLKIFHNAVMSQHNFFNLFDMAGKIVMVQKTRVSRMFFCSCSWRLDGLFVSLSLYYCSMCGCLYRFIPIHAKYFVINFISLNNYEHMRCQYLLTRDKSQSPPLSIKNSTTYEPEKVQVDGHVQQQQNHCCIGMRMVVVMFSSSNCLFQAL